VRGTDQVSKNNWVTRGKFSNDILKVCLQAFENWNPVMAHQFMTTTSVKYFDWNKDRQFIYNYDKKFWTVMVDNFTNINKTNKYLSPLSSLLVTYLCYIGWDNRYLFYITIVWETIICCMKVSFISYIHLTPPHFCSCPKAGPDIIIIRKNSSWKWKCMNYKNIFLHFDRVIKTYNIHMIMKKRNNMNIIVK
jgi:hypothetical protein